MNTVEIASIPSNTLERLLAPIPFYKAVKKQDEGQYQALLRYSKIVQFGPGEDIISRGQMDSWSYFLLKGQLVVSLPDSHGRPLLINHITPGEVFGDLSLLLAMPRTADVVVDENCREALVFGTDFSLFGQLLNFNIVSLETKLLYYRHTVQTLRWRLEMYRSQYRDNPLADKHRNIKIYSGTKDGLNELHALHEQSVDFSKLLVQWNRELANLTSLDGKLLETDIAI